MDIKEIVDRVLQGSTVEPTAQVRDTLLKEYDLESDIWPMVGWKHKDLDLQTLLWLQSARHIKSLDKQIQKLESLPVFIDTDDLKEFKEYIEILQRLITVIKNDQCYAAQPRYPSHHRPRTHH